MRIVQDQEAVLRLRVEDEGGTLVAADSTPTITVSDHTGTALSGGAAPSAVTAESTGIYTSTLPPRASLDVLTANWSFSPTGSSYTRAKRETLVGVSDRVVPLWRLREDPELTDLSTLDILRLSQKIDDWAESALGFAPVETAFTRTFRQRLSSTEQLLIPGVPYPKSLTSVVVDGTAWTSDDLSELIYGIGVWRDTGANLSFLTGTPTNRIGFSYGSYVVRGTHGPPNTPDWEDGVPVDLQDALVALARYAAREGRNYPERATQISDESTLIMFSMPGPGRPTGLPEVDGTIVRYSLQQQV